MQIRVPGDVEFAALMPMGLQQEIKGAASESAYVFGDGERASKTRFDYGGVLFITHELDKNTQLQFRRSASKWLNEMSDIVNKKHRRNEDGTPMAFENLQMAGNGAIGWRVNSLFTAYMDVGKSSILWKLRGRPEDMAATRRAYNFLIAGTTPRETFSTPARPGVCLPYLFIPDDGETSRVIAMTYRLKSHPDVTIWLEDASAGVVEELGRDDDQSPAYRIPNFWVQYKLVDEKLTSLWNFPTTRPIEMNGIKGSASYMKITRADKSEDFGFFAVVRGRAAGAREFSDLSLLVVRDSAKARGKKIAPIDEKIFLKIAEGVAASVKRRPTR